MQADRRKQNLINKQLTVAAGRREENISFRLTAVGWMRPKFNVNSNLQGQKEIGENQLASRFLEGGASGAVMIGAPPTGAVFKQHMDWLDAVINVPLDGGNIVEIITKLDTQPERLAKIRRDNVFNCLMRHDWVYRWEVILEKIGLTPKPQVDLRKNRLVQMIIEFDKYLDLNQRSMPNYAERRTLEFEFPV